ncbi:hypothetical protein ACI65C_003545 [Semiaphis heraclei]
MNKNKKPSFLRALFQMFGFKLILCGTYLAITDMVFSVIQTIFVGKIISHFESKNTKHQFDMVVYYAVGLIITCSLKTFSSNSYNMMSSHLAMKMRVATCDLIYNKALRLKTNSLETTTGRIVNLLSNDVIRFDLTIVYIGYVFTGPLETIMVTYFLWKEVGAASILGVATFIIFIPLQAWLGSSVSKSRLETANRTDARVNLMNEIISGIQVIKMYTWEYFFTKLTEFSRKKEIDQITKTAYIKATLLSFSMFNTRLALFLSVLLYVILGNYINASKVFIITSYYNILRVSMAVTFPVGIGLIAELLVSIKRIEDFLLREEKDKQSISQTKTTNDYENSRLSDNCSTVPNNIGNHDNTEQSSKFCINVSNVTAKWTDSQTDNTLENINLTVSPGRLVAIIGAVGAGKSSLMQAILRELSVSSGSISVHGVVSYASQQPWLFAGSVQRNILFGLPMDRNRYNKIIQVCALQTDFDQFPYGDRTIVGERGISLSGGQRARINLARAIYKEADIYLLDDPLSAVDNHVGKHLFAKCIKEFLKGKTCILITHQLQYLTNLEQIVLMENGKKIAEDSYKNLQESGLNFTKMLGSPIEPVVTSDNESITKRPNFRSQNSIYTRQVSVLSVTSTVEENNYNDVQVEVVEVVEPIETAETRSYGNSGFSNYSSYFSAGGHKCKIFLFLFLCILTQILSSSGDIWITYWVNLEEHIFRSISHLEAQKDNKSNSSNTLIPWIANRQTCIVVFAVITTSIIISTLIRSAFFVSVCTTSSTNLHNRMLRSIIRTTMHFFNKNPSGRILNRFSKDIGSIDEMLPFVLMDVIQIGLIVIGILIIVAITNPFLIMPTLIIVVIFFKIRNIYMTISQSIKRLEGVTRSPVITHLNASLQGITTIRAFEAEQVLSAEFSIHQDLHSSAWYLFICSSRAFGFWLDLTCLVYISIVTFCFLIIDKDTYSGNVGLAITQSIGLIGLFQWGMRRSVELENQMTSVERVLEYTVLPQEPALESPQNKKPPKNWPDKGRITFNNFYLRYDVDTHYVLSNLNIHIEPTEKIGIVGRTGAGKSSLIGALFRLALSEGSITIDNLEIHELGLHDLRSKLTFIPQEPVLFSGTIRNNLDLYNKYSDNEIWSVLNEVELKDVVKDLPNGLYSKMSDGGSNFSVGQRQLVCLARAILQNNRILVLDEVTANVDHRTDALIQNTIKNKFRMCTVLTIAHRLNTVMDSDKILVMDGGTVVEFDHPFRLLKNTYGYFYKMVKQTDQNTARLLHTTAAEESVDSYDHESDEPSTELSPIGDGTERLAHGRRSRATEVYTKTVHREVYIPGKPPLFNTVYLGARNVNMVVHPATYNLVHHGNVPGIQWCTRLPRTQRIAIRYRSVRRTFKTNRQPNYHQSATVLIDSQRGGIIVLPSLNASQESVDSYDHESDEPSTELSPIGDGTERLAHGRRSRATEVYTKTVHREVYIPGKPPLFNTVYLGARNVNMVVHPATYNLVHHGNVPGIQWCTRLPRTQRIAIRYRSVRRTFKTNRQPNYHQSATVLIDSQRGGIIVLPSLNASQESVDSYDHESDEPSTELSPIGDGTERLAHGRRSRATEVYTKTVHREVYIPGKPPLFNTVYLGARNVNMVVHPATYNLVHHGNVPGIQWCTRLPRTQRIAIRYRSVRRTFKTNRQPNYHQSATVLIDSQRGGIIVLPRYTPRRCTVWCILVTSV